MFKYFHIPSLFQVHIDPSLLPILSTLSTFSKEKQKYSMTTSPITKNHIQKEKKEEKKIKSENCKTLNNLKHIQKYIWRTILC